MVRYDSASRVRCSTALRLHMERGLKAGTLSTLTVFLTCFYTFLTGHDWSKTKTANMESPAQVLSSWPHYFGIKLLLSSLQPFHYSHVQLIYARINGFIIHTITQPLHRDRNILPSFQPQQCSLSSTLPYDIYYNMRFRKWH